MNDRSLQSQANSAPVEGESSPVTRHHARAAPSVSAGSRGSPRIATFFASSGSASHAASIFRGGNHLDLTLAHPSSGNERTESSGPADSHAELPSMAIPGLFIFFQR